MYGVNSKKKKKKQEFFLNYLDWIGITLIVIGLLLIILGLVLNYSSKPPKKLPYFHQEKNYFPEYRYRFVPRDYAINLQRKGYTDIDIGKLADWNLPTENLPDLRTEMRVGVIKILGVVSPQGEEENKWGECNDIVVVCRQNPLLNQTGPLVNIDNLIHPDNRSDRNYVKKLVSFAFSDYPDYLKNLEVSILIANCLRPNMGKSWGISLYLALLSAAYQKPISRSVAATGVVSTGEKKGKMGRQKVHLAKGTSLPISGLKHKVPAAYEKEVNRVVFSKYNVAPHNHLSIYKKNESSSIFSDIFDQGSKNEDYKEEVPGYIREKINPYFTEDYRDLQKLLWEGNLS